MDDVDGEMKPVQLLVVVKVVAPGAQQMVVSVVVVVVVVFALVLVFFFFSLLLAAVVLGGRAVLACKVPTNGISAQVCLLATFERTRKVSVSVLLHDNLLSTQRSQLYFAAFGIFRTRGNICGLARHPRAVGAEKLREAHKNGAG